MVGPSNQAATKLQAGPSHAVYGRRSSVRCAGVWGVGSVYTSGGLELKVAHDQSSERPFSILIFQGVVGGTVKSGLVFVRVITARESLRDAGTSLLSPSYAPNNGRSGQRGRRHTEPNIIHGTLPGTVSCSSESQKPASDQVVVLSAGTCLVISSASGPDNGGGGGCHTSPRASAFRRSDLAARASRRNRSSR